MKCPVCNTPMFRASGKSAGWAHPTYKQCRVQCPLNGHHLGDSYMDDSPFLRYTVVDGKPRFAHSTEGKLVTADFLNQVVDYLMKAGEYQ